MKIKYGTKGRWNSGFRMMKTSNSCNQLREPEEVSSEVHFPISRIKTILKSDESFKQPMRKEAYYYIQRATV